MASNPLENSIVAAAEGAAAGEAAAAAARPTIDQITAALAGLPLPSESTFQAGTLGNEDREFMRFRRLTAQREAARRERRRLAREAAGNVKAAGGGATCAAAPPRIKRWFLLPGHAVHHAISIQLAIQCTSITQALRYVKAYRDLGKVSTKGLPTFERIVSTPSLLFGALEEPLLAAYETAVFKNTWIRRCFSTLARAWLLKRKVVAMNDTDLVTCEAAREPVQVVDWAGRRCYTFEATTIQRDATARLMLHDELWPMIQAPRNPYTNIPLELGQLIGLREQLRRWRRSHWTVDALASVGYDLVTYRRNFAEPLRLAALKRIFATPGSDACKDMLFEFIETEHDEHEQKFNSSLYLWALEHALENELMVQWRRICYKYHELNITVSDPGMLAMKQNLVVNPVTKVLCMPALGLLRLRNQWHKQKLLDEAAARAAAAAKQESTPEN